MTAPAPLAVVHVVVPVCDEERTLAGCLRAIEVSLGRAAEQRPGVTGRCTVVLDNCTDDSAAIVAALGGHAVEVQVRSVGAARAAGVEHVRRTVGEVDPARVWVATTDGDSLVSPGWLDEQLGLAEQGCDLVVGRVRLDPREVSDDVLRLWRARHPQDGIHVFGANLGFRLSAYDRVGGFAAIGEHEDVGLVDAMLAAGVPWRCGTLDVTTSARTTGRTPGGFARYLHDLGAEVVALRHP